MNNESPKVSIIMPSYNHEDYVGYAIESVLEQTYSNWELVIVDDGSKDNSINIIEKYAEKDQRIRLYKQENKGVSATMNKAILLSTGEYICFLDSDDAYHPEKLEKQFAMVECGFNFITTKITTIDENGEVTLDSSIEKWFNEFDHNQIFNDKIEINFLKKNYVCKASVMLKREFFDKYGLFDERLITAYDFHYWMKILKNVKITRCEEKLTYYRWHGDNETIKNNSRMKLEISLIFAELRKKISKEGMLVNKTEYNKIIDCFLIENDVFDFSKTLESYVLNNKVEDIIGLINDKHFVSKFKKYIIRRNHKKQSFFAVVKRYFLTGMSVVKKRGLISFLKRCVQVLFFETAFFRKISKFFASSNFTVKYTGLIFYRKIKKETNVGKNSNILFLIPWMTVGGGDKVNLDLANNLNKNKFTLHFITTNKSENEWACKFKKITTNVFDLTRYSIEPFYCLFILKYIEIAKINKIVISNSAVGYDCIPYIKKRFPKVQIIDLLHGQGGKSEQGGFPEYSARFDKYIDKRIVISDYLKGYLIEKYKISENKIIVIKNGIDEKKFDALKTKSDLTLSLKNNNSEKVISFIGRLSIEKHPEKIIEIADELINKRKENNVMFVLAGNGPLFEELKEKIEKLNLASKVKMIGSIENVGGLLRGADLLLLTSEMEGMPIVILEALSMGVPVISTNVGGVKEIIEDEKQGFLIEYGPGMIENYAKKIQILLNDAEKLTEFKIAARNRIIDNFTIQNSISKYENVLD